MIGGDLKSGRTSKFMLKMPIKTARLCTLCKR